MDKVKIFFVIALCIVAGSILFLFISDQYNPPNVRTNETTYQQTVDECYGLFNNYTTSNPDYLTCDNQDECDLKRLRLNLLQQQAFNCMNQSWEDRK